jgi:uncharacterized protein
MTPEERNQVTELFDRLATLEGNPRDREAERLIQEGLRHAPNAPYTLVQTALIQDEALKRADNRIRELEAQLGTGGEPRRQGGFLENMRESVFGKRAGSVPTVRPSGESSSAPMGAPPGYQAQPMAQQPMPQQPMGQPMPQPSAGGSFLGTAAAAAVGVVGGALLADSIRGMMTGHRGGGQAHAAFEPAGGGGQGTPWGGSGGDGNLARDLGVNDIGRSSGSGGGAPRNQGLVDSDSNETAADANTNDANYVSDDDPSYAAGDQNDAPEFDDSENDFGGDIGGDGGGGSDE